MAALVYKTQHPDHFGYKCPHCGSGFDDYGPGNWYYCMHSLGGDDSITEVSLDSEGGGWWGTWNVPGTAVVGASRHGQRVTVTHQRLNAAEAVVAAWSPILATTIRIGFDWLEVYAHWGKTKSWMHPLRWLWESGRVIFPTMGVVGAVVVSLAGKRSIISQQYRIAVAD